MKISLLALLFALSLGPKLAAQTPLFIKNVDPANGFNSWNSGQSPYKGAAWTDFDGDGKPDLCLTPRRLYRNLGGGKFEEKGFLLAAPAGQGPSGASWGDWDNDGFADLVMAQRPASFWKNEAGAAMSDVSAAVADFQSPDEFPSWACAMADWDSDGLLDAVFAYANGFHQDAGPDPCKFFRQNGLGGWEKKAGWAFTDSLAPYTVPYWSDFDLDGDQDLFVAAGPAAPTAPDFDFCYRNRLKEDGAAGFERLKNELFAAQKQDGQCYNFPDIDLDGDRDLLLTNYVGAPTRLYRREANGSFVEVAAPFSKIAQHLTATWGDFDLDGFEDVVITADAGAAKFYRNLGDFQFEEVAGAFPGTASAASAAACDMDDDGDLDLFFHGANAGKGLWANQKTGGNWANFRLEGTVSNRSAIGAVVRLKAKNGLWQLREISAQNVFQGHSDQRAHFGLGAATEIDSLEVRWPAGGKSLFAGLAGNQFYKITEGGGIVLAQKMELKTGEPAFFSLEPNPFDERFWVKTELEKSEKWAVELFDSSGRLVPFLTVRADGGFFVEPKKSLPSGVYFLKIRDEKGRTATLQAVKK